MLAIWGHGCYGAHIWFHGPDSAAVCDDVQAAYYDRKPGGQDYTELARPLTARNTRQSWPCTSPAVTLGKTGPTPPLGSSIELTLLGEEGTRVSQPLNVSMRGLDFPPIFHTDR